MDFFKKQHVLLVIIASLLFIVACGSSDADLNAGDGSGDKTTTGGTLNIAMDAPPPTLDQPTNPATATRDTARLIFETLMTTDSSHQAVPMLAESVDTDDNQTFTFKLLEGVKFHNGDEMTADDVVVSMERWLEKSSITGDIFNDATWTAEDDYTVVLELATPSALTLDTMASAKQAAAIMPKEIVESAPAEGIEEYVGTGPFEFKEWKQDQYIHFTKFDDYQPKDEEANGLAGKKEALVDEVYFHLVPDTSTRMAGLQTGEYDFAYNIPYDNYDQFEADPMIETVLTPSSNVFIGFNNVKGIASDVNMRKAINTGIDPNEMMMAAFPNDDFYWLDSGYMDKHIETWASTAGSEYYNQNDPEGAKEMLEDMGYDGEKFVVIATRDYDHHYNTAVVFHQQLIDLGVDAELTVYDWPTLIDKITNEPNSWDAYVAATSTVSTPPQLIAISPTWAGGVNDDYMLDTMGDIEKTATIEEAQELWDELQLYALKDAVPILSLGGYHSFFAHSDKVSGVTTTSGPIFWNVSIKE